VKAAKRPKRLAAIAPRGLSSSSFHGNAELFQLFVWTQFPRESATRFSRENRYTPFLELL
jgi:hypothetical protein